MSKFSTTIPIPVEAVKGSLPAGVFIHGVRLSEDSVILEWEKDEWRTPYTVPVEISPEQLLSGELPECVKVPEGFRKVQNEEVAPAAPRRAPRKQ